MRRNRPFVSLLGYYGFGNAGDEWILSEIVKIQNVKWLVLSHHPEDTNRSLGLEALSRWSPWQVTKAFWRSSVLVVGGGELFQTRSSVASWGYYSVALLWAKLLGCRLVAYGLSVDPHLPALFRCLTFWLLGLCDRLWLREGSALPAYPVPTMPDPVFAADVSSGPVDHQSQKFILWVLRAPPRGKEQPPWEELLNSLSRKGYSHAWLAFHPREDVPYGRSLFSNLGVPAKEGAWSKGDHLCSLFSSAGVIVTNRYHALLLSLLSGRGAVALSGWPKVDDLSRRWGFPLVKDNECSVDVWIDAFNKAQSPGKGPSFRLAQERERVVRAREELNDYLRKAAG